jgi:toxin-antitoxin system PIN domain toxin
MKRCLVDVNVLFALLVERHDHHKRVSEWFDGLSAGEAALCRFVQLALIRLLGNRTVMGDGAVPAGVAWHAIGQLLEDERIDFIAEPEQLDSILPELFRYRASTNQLISDAYLAAFAVAASFRMATMDRGFSQFKDLDVVVI